MRRKITILPVAALIWIVGCATTPPEPEVVTEEQEVVQETIATTVDPEALKCPVGTTEWCVRRLRKEKCRCVKDSLGRDVMETLPNPDWQKRR